MGPILEELHSTVLVGGWALPEPLSGPSHVCWDIQVPQAVLLPYLLLYHGHTGPFSQLLPSPTLSKGLQFPTALHSSPQMREAAPWEVDIVVPEKASYMKENAVPTSKTGFQRRSDGLCPLTHKNRIQHLLCMLTTKDFKR